MIIPDDITEAPIALKDQYFDLKGLSVYSAIAVGTIRDHIKTRGLPNFKVAGKILVKRSEFDSWVEKYRSTKSLNHIVDDVMDSLKG